LLQDERFDEARMEAIEEGVEETLDQAVAFAQSSEEPPIELAWEHVYA
jgi:TPP-dependent pyruvate/acetoin dehydrogenase alpha subunit